MKIFVLVKEVPDTYGDRTLNLETGLADRGAGDVVLDEITERALEVALSYADKNEGTEVVALTMAPESATASVRRALAIGAASAIHIVDEQLVGADLGLTAEVLAAAIRRGAPDLVITGNLSTDGAGGVLPRCSPSTSAGRRPPPSPRSRSRPTASPAPAVRTRGTSR